MDNRITSWYLIKYGMMMKNSMIKLIAYQHKLIIFNYVEQHFDPQMSWKKHRANSLRKTFCLCLRGQMGTQ